MKRFFTTILLLFVMAGAGINAETRKTEDTNAFTQLFEKYQETDGVELFDLKGLVLSMAKPSIRKTPVGKAADGIKHMQIFSMAEPGTKLRTNFTKEVEAILAGYEMAMETKEDKLTSRIYVKKASEEVISEMIVYTIEESIVVIYMTGEIPVHLLEVNEQ